MQRKQAHEADTWREMCTIPVSVGQDADGFLAAGKRGGGGAGNMGLKLMGHQKDDRDKEEDEEDEVVEEDTELPPGTRCRPCPMTGGRGHTCTAAAPAANTISESDRIVRGHRIQAPPRRDGGRAVYLNRFSVNLCQNCLPGKAIEAWTSS